MTDKIPLSFDEAFDRLIGNEGGYVNDPRDPGGETNWGITKRVAMAHGYMGAMQSMTRDQAKKIYLTSYWNVIGPDVHPAIKFQVFDFAVNAGVETAIRKLQAAVNVATDGRWGPISAAALKAMSIDVVLMRFAAVRLQYYTSLSHWPDFGKGWARRIAIDLQYSATDL